MIEHDPPKDPDMLADVVTLPRELRLRVEEMARTAEVNVAEMIVRLVTQGERCQRNHESAK